MCDLKLQANFKVLRLDDVLALHTFKGSLGLSRMHEKGHQSLTAPVPWKLEVIDDSFISIQRT